MDYQQVGSLALYTDCIPDLLHMSDKAQMVNLMERYFQNISDKACCFEDLKPYLGLRDDDLSRWTVILESYSPSFVSSCHFGDHSRYFTTDSLTDDIQRPSSTNQYP
jgi:hypothetical protein